MSWALLMLVLSWQETPLEQARVLKAEGDLYAAEGYLLAAEWTLDDVDEVASELASLAFRLDGSPDKSRKRAFYSEYLTRSRPWRAISLYVLTAIAVNAQDWDAMTRYGADFLREFPELSAPSLRFRLLYHLSRYTSLDEEQFQLKEAERTWFRLCRNLDPALLFPRQTQNTWPLPSRASVRFDQALPNAPREQLWYLIFKLRRTLEADDMVNASALINQIGALDREQQDLEARLFYYPALQAFFTGLERTESAAVVARNLSQIQSFVVMPYRSYPERIATLAESVSDVETDVEVEEPEPEPEPEPIPVVTSPEPESETEDTVAVDPFDALERRLNQNARGLELELRNLSPNSPYQRILKNYLLGRFFLSMGRTAPAIEQLALAERLIIDYPFPNLEIKIQHALADLDDADNPDRAQWRRLKAAQIWRAVEHLPIFADTEIIRATDPHLILIDEALDRLSDDESVHRLLYYSESAHFQNLRLLAYQRKVLSENETIANQLGRSGARIDEVLRDLHTRADLSGGAADYNQAVNLWRNLWRQTRPFFQEDTFPGVPEVQTKLNARDRMLIFIEGVRDLGVLVLSDTQAFAVNLGSKGNFTRLSEDERFDFLQARLGPVWSQRGLLLLKLSPTFRADGFLDALRARMAEGAELQILFSLKAFVASKRAVPCRRALLFSQTNDAAVDRLYRQLPEGSRRLLQGQARRNLLMDESERHDQIFLLGAFAYDQEGLRIETADGEAFIHRLGLRNRNLCRLVLAPTNDFKQWWGAIEELELISPDASLTVYMLDDLESYQTLQNRRFGVFFP